MRVIAAAGLVPLIALFAALRTGPTRTVIARVATRIMSFTQRFTHRPTGDPHVVARATIERFCAFRLDRSSGTTVLMYATVNWLADIGCLAAAIEFVGHPVPWRSLTLVYAAAIGAATIGFTPAGIGIVETAIAAALTASGLPGAVALSAAVAYRAISCWLVLAVGWLILARLPPATTETPTTTAAG